MGSDVNTVGRVPNATHESHFWRIHEIVPDFKLEDVWALPVWGGPEDAEKVLLPMASFDPANVDSFAARSLWRLRDRLGNWFSLGRISVPTDDGVDFPPIPGTSETSLAGRLPEDLRGTATDVDFGSLPFVPLYRTDVEFAAELSNATAFGVMHLAWAEQDDGRYQAQMAVYVKPRGALGKGYMALIKPFRYLIVYPALMRQIERMSDERTEPDPVHG